MNDVTQSAHRQLDIVHLAGNEKTMGAQHGEMYARDARLNRLIHYFHKLPVQVIRSALPRHLRKHPLTSASLQGVTRTWSELMARSAGKVTGDRVRYNLRAAGLPDHGLAAGYAMDVLQNVINVVSNKANGVGQVVPGNPALAACSTLVTWDVASRDGSLMHARNFDFPAPGIWNEKQAVVFCKPDRGIPYGFVTAAGADSVCVTVFNEAGLVITPHTRFNRHIATRGIGIVELCHTLAREAGTLNEAIQVARRQKINSSWGIVVSSANERDAIVLETNSRRTAVHRSEHTSFLGNTNHYLTELRKSAVSPGAGFDAHTHGRLERLQEFGQHAIEHGGCSAEDLQRLLGDRRNAGSGREVLGANTLTNPMCVTATVVEPEKQQVHVANGSAPISRQIYATIPWSWSDQPGIQTVEVVSDAQPTRFDQAELLLSEAVRLDLEHRSTWRADEKLVTAHKLASDDPSLNILMGGLHARDGKFREAADCFEIARDNGTHQYYSDLAENWWSACRSLGYGDARRSGFADKLGRRHQNIVLEYGIGSVSLS